MIIYLDESKKTGESKIVFGGFLTHHKASYIEKILQSKKESYGFSNLGELKGTGEKGKEFYNRMTIDTNFLLLKRSIIGGNFTGYNKDSLENYRKCIFIIVNRILPILQNYKGKIYIYADKITLGKTNYVEKNISDYLQNNISTQGSFIFQFKNSKNNLGIQIADLLSYQVRLCCINNQDIDDYLFNNTLNLDLQEEFEI